MKLPFNVMSLLGYSRQLANALCRVGLLALLASTALPTAALAVQSLPFTLVQPIAELPPIPLSIAERKWLAEHAQPLRIGISINDYEPLDIAVDRNRYQGVSADYLNLIRGRLEVSMQIFGFARRDDAVEALQRGEIDVLTSANRYERPWPGVVFSRGYLPDRPVIARRGLDADNHSASLAGKRVALLEGYADASEIRAAYPESEIVLAPSLSSGLEALRQGDVDAFVGNEVILRSYMALRPYAQLRISGNSLLPPGNFKFAMRNTDGPLAAMFERALSSISAPLQREILNRWTAGLGTGMAQRPVTLEADETAWIAAHPRVRVAATEYPPYLYRDRQGRWVGMNADVLAVLSQMTGLQFDFVTAESIANSIDLLKSGQADMSTTLSDTLERRAYLEFSHAYGGQGWVFIVRRDEAALDSLDELSGRTLAMPAQHALLDMVRREHPDIRIKLVATSDQAREAVIKGQADATIDSEVGAYRTVSRDPDKGLKVGRSVEGAWTSDRFSVAAANPQLTRILNEALEAFPVAELRAIRLKWLGSVTPEVPVWRRIAPWVYWAAGVAGLIAVVSLLWNGRLKVQIVHRKRLEAELTAARRVAEDANQAKSSFLATMSHDIRTPLAAIIALLELERAAAAAKVQPYSEGLQVALRSANELLELVGDSLDLARIEAGRLELHLTPVELPLFFQDVARLFRPQAERKGLQLTLHIEPACAASYWIDAVRLRQVMHNLLGNALKFTQQGSIGIGVQAWPAEAGAQLQITVEDTGIGIAAQRQAELFKPYVQASDESAQTYGGAGLGLSICQQLVDLMGGTITMASAPGQGTQIAVKVFVGAAPAAAQAETTGNMPLPMLGSLQVLIADDLSSNRLVLSRQLELLGHGVIAVDSGEAALASWLSQPVDVLITDCNMPGISGYELAHRIRELEAQTDRPRLPIIGCTANVLSDVGARCEAAGMDEWLSKPLKTGRLASLLAQLTKPQSFDPVTLKSLAQADPSILQRMLGELERNLSEELPCLQEAVAQVAWEAIDAALHRLKGICALIDAAPLALACGPLATASKHSDAASLVHSWPVLREAMEQLLSDIRRANQSPARDSGPRNG